MSKCAKCNKSVYAMEEVKALKRSWHAECLTCLRCSKRLTGGNWEEYQGQIYCNHCFNEYIVDKDTKASIDQMNDSRAGGLSKVMAKSLPGMGGAGPAIPRQHSQPSTVDTTASSAAPMRAMPASLLAGIQKGAKPSATPSAAKPAPAPSVAKPAPSAAKPFSAPSAVKPASPSPAPALKFCTECGAKNTGKFCQGCGRKM